MISTRFGCRTIGFDVARDFLFNGSPYPLRGVSFHQNRMGLGNVLTAREHQEDMDIIREIGANTICLVHNQHAQEFYDLCDESGIIVWAEIPYITQHVPNGRRTTLDQMRGGAELQAPPPSYVGGCPTRLPLLDQRTRI